LHAVARPVVLVSNRGPLSFGRADDGSLVPRRGGGGLVTALGPAVAGTGATWVAAALSEADREAAASGVVEGEGFRWQSLVLDEDDYRAYYDVISNGTLWFLHHGLWDLPRRPRYDRFWRAAWDAYRRVNRAFADAVVEEAPEGALVAVHDLHLTLVPPVLAAERPDVSVVHFTHTPFCEPGAVRALPAEVAAEVVGGMAAAGACGFHARRWEAAFLACCDEVGVAPPRTFVAPAAADPEDVARTARSEACGEALARLEGAVGDRKVIARVDRIELSKNLLRGFLAYEELLRAHPEWVGEVVFAAAVYPSREGLAEYLSYRQEVDGLVRRINDTWGTDGWTPILWDVGDDYPRSVALLRRADVLLVNPVRDGLNLIAKEGVLANERDAVLALSREAGAWEELAEVAMEVHPFDVTGTAEVLHEALSLPAGERRARFAALRDRVAARTPADWWADQLAAAAP
jgi:trehalose 6-phosphate synthase